MQTVCWGRTLPDLAPGNLGEARGREKSSKKHKAVEEFAQNMSGDIMESFLRKNQARSDRRHGAFGGEAAVAACRAGHVDQTLEDEGGHEEGVWDPDGDRVAGFLIHKRPLLTEALASLDYPDAPPTTPLLPEPQNSWRSFSQKLKGGLAKVFPPSPPPPTPMEREDGAAGGHQVGLDELLMDSLAFHETRVEELAEALSLEIMGRVFRSEDQEQTAEGAELHLLAQRMAETIIASSLDAGEMSA